MLRNCGPPNFRLFALPGFLVSSETIAVFLLAAALVAAGCTGTSGKTGAPETCLGYDLENQSHEYSPCRVFRGRLRLPQQKQLTLPDRPFQVVGLGFVPRSGGPAAGDAAPSKRDGAVPSPGAGKLTDKVAPQLFYGAPFRSLQGGGLRDATPFAAVVPCQMSVNLLLQIPRTSGDEAPGILVAPMAFARTTGTGTTTLIPRQSADTCAGKLAEFDLGLVDLELTQRGDLTSGSITLGKGNSNSPLSLVPPPEGQTSDQDTDADGIVDTAETLASLEDIRTPSIAPDSKPHPDGIPDLFQEHP